MLTVPLLVGTLRGSPDWAHLWLAAFWLIGYFAFFAAGQWLRSRRRPRNRPPVIDYTVAAAAVGVPLAAVRPDLLAWVPVYLSLAAASFGYSVRRDDRALLNDGLTILAACLVGLVAFQLGHGGAPFDADRRWTSMWVISAALFCYFFGTSLYVKTLIRERTNRRYHLASVAYHLVVAAGWALAVALGVPLAESARPWLVAFFVVTAVRAAVMAGRRVRPRSAGLGELAASAALTVICLL